MTVLLSRPVTPSEVEEPPRQVGVRSLLRWTRVCLAVLCLWSVAYVIVLGAALESGAQKRLYGEFRAQLSQATAPLSSTAPGRPVALIDAPTIDLAHVVVVEGTAAGQLQDGPGHRRDTVLPGQVGVSVLYGKGTTFGAPFAHLPDLRPGDPITVVTGQGTGSYRVTGIRHGGDPLPAPPLPGQGRLTLVTQVGGGWRTGWAPTDAVYVDATALAAHPAAPTTSGIARSERLLASDAGALMALVLWLEALLVVVAAGAWAWGRWGRWQSWLVAAPAVFAVLCGSSAVAARLLPNVL